MNSFRRLIMRGSDCVGVIVGLGDSITLVVEISGSPGSVDQFASSVPTESGTVDHWFNALDELLPMTYRIGPAIPFSAQVSGKEAAQELAEEHIVTRTRSRRLTTTRVSVTSRIADGDSPSDAIPESTPANEVEPTDRRGEPSAMPSSASPELSGSLAAPSFVARPQPQQALRSLADDGAGLLEHWFLLLEDWHGLTAIFAGDREKYTLLSRAATAAMSQQIADAVPSEAANLEHWVSCLVRSLPAGLWLRSFTDARVLTDEELHTPAEILQAAVRLFGTPSPHRSHELVAVGDIDGSLDLNPDSNKADEPEAEEELNEESAEASAG